ncbi:putative oligopeptide/dipeptide ABC transporter, permease protein [Variovorax paradoxus B4]|uniref:Putative oligopeptide/dipeptide ABC transporter, permease protein n=1 Tax=Variovorax paradoxus B4 TaxID=1246301 RepID=T1XLL3_VARPD|nr:ABC transporter permease [Variovorax paradoxus]AGU53174.1 putative oligopeptide/dipeptide ABC transporter, permease protein [Variovorax paradoxus B4]
MTTMFEEDESPLRRLLRQYARSRLAVLGAAVLLALMLAALFAPLLAPQNPYDLAQLDILDSRLPPGSHSGDDAAGHGRLYLLGTDDQGRDMLSGMLYGLRISLGIGVVATLAALSLGATLGLLAAYAGGRLDALLMRIVDIQLSFPAILVALVLVTLLKPGVGNVAIALVAVQWAYYARTVRAAALVERRKEYIEAAQGLALSDARIVLRHLLPNCLPPVIVVAALQVANAISLEATLSFLGLGVPITEPSLGLLIANGQQYLLAGKYWMSLYPGVLLLLTILAINLVADQLRDVSNPRLQKQ